MLLGTGTKVGQQPSTWGANLFAASSETSAKALGNSKAVADKHYIKPKTVLPDVRRAVNDAVSELIN